MSVMGSSAKEPGHASVDSMGEGADSESGNSCSQRGHDSRYDMRPNAGPDRRDRPADHPGLELGCDERQKQGQDPDGATGPG